MELIERIEKSLFEMKLIDPNFDVHEDKNGNIYGFITSPSFETMNDEDAQKMIWEKLKKDFEHHELTKIMSLINETPLERLNRSGSVNIEENKSKCCYELWEHICPDMDRYIIFISITKIQNEYKATYFWLSEMNKSGNLSTTNYTEDVINFMELEQKDIIPELYSNTLNIAESEVKLDIIKKHQELVNKNIYGQNNIYSYVYHNFKIHPIQLKKLLLKSKDFVDEIEKIVIKTPDSLHKENVLKQISINKAILQSSKQEKI